MVPINYEVKSLADVRRALWEIQSKLAAQSDLVSGLAAKLDASLVSAAGLALIDDANAAAQRTTLGLGSAATTAASAYAATVHAHTISDVTGLQAALDAKQDA